MDTNSNKEDLNSYMWQYRQACKTREPFSSLSEEVKRVFNKLSICDVDLETFFIGDPWLAGVAYIDMCTTSLTQELNRLCAYNFATLAIMKARNEQMYQLALPLRASIIDKNWDMYVSVYKEFVDDMYRNGYEELSMNSTDDWEYPSLNKIDFLIMSDVFACTVDIRMPGYEDLKDEYNSIYIRHYSDFTREEVIKYGHRLHELFSTFMIKKYNPAKVFKDYK